MGQTVLHPGFSAAQPSQASSLQPMHQQHQQQCYLQVGWNRTDNINCAVVYKVLAGVFFKEFSLAVSLWASADVISMNYYVSGHDLSFGYLCYGC